MEDILPSKIGLSTAWALLLCPILTGAASLGAWNARQDFASYDYGRNILHSLPPSSSLFMDGGDDTFYSLAYLTLAQGLRPDLDLHDRGGLVFPNPYGPDFLELPKAMKEDQRVILESALARQGRLYYSTLNQHLLPGFVLNPQGLLQFPAPTKEDNQTSDALWAVYSERWNMNLLQSHYRDRSLVAVYPAMRAAGLASEEKFPQAIKGLHEVWLLSPDALWTKPQIVYQSGVVAYEAAQKLLWLQVQSALEFAQTIDPDNTDVLCNLGVAYEHMGQMQKAEATYLKAAALDPNLALAYYNLGELYWKMQRWKETAQAMSKASRLDPDNAAWAAFARQAAVKTGEGYGK